MRDLLLDRPSPDIDLAVESHLPEFGAELARRLDGAFIHHARFQTGTVLLMDGSHIDVTRSRTEIYDRPATLPRVSPAGIEADLVRRDFTINAIALELTPGRRGRFIDPHDGRADIARRTVRILHRRSFEDDPTRIFRCIRFAIRFGFSIEPATLVALRASIGDRDPSRLTPERILNELRLICAEPLFLPMVEALVKERVLHSALEWHPPAGFLRDLARLATTRARPYLLYVCWLSTLPLTDRFPLTSAERAAAETLRRRAPLLRRLAAARRPSSVYRLLKPVSEPALAVLISIEPTRAATKVRRYLDEYRHVRPALDGRGLRRLGIEPGPRLGRVLERLLCARLDGRISDMLDEVRLARRLARTRGTA